MVSGILLSVVADLELTASQTVKLILLLILVVGAFLNVFWAYRAITTKKKFIRIMIAVLLFLISLPVMKWYDIEGNLLNHAEYTAGITIGICDEFAKGAAIEIVYEVEGVEYQNCNTYHPIKKENIIVPNGKYDVRYSNKYPEKGRMDFQRPAE